MKLLLSSHLCALLFTGGLAWTNASGQEASQNPKGAPVLPLPESKEGQEMLNPLLTTPPEGLPPLSTDFKIEAIPENEVSANALSHWSIARFPERENRDAMAAFWSRVSSSKTRWQVWLDQSTGAAVADENAPRPELPSVDWTLPSDPSSPWEPLKVWSCQSGWLVFGRAAQGETLLLWCSPDGKRKENLGRFEQLQHVQVAQRDFLLERRSNRLLELKLSQTKAELVPFHQFEKSQQVCAITAFPDQRIGVVTPQRLLAMTLEKSVETVLSSPGWAAFQPNSAVYDPKAQRVYVGMRHFVARCAIEPGKRASVWLRPNR